MFPAIPVADDPYLRVPIAVVKHHDQSKLGGILSLQLMFPQYSFSLNEVRAGTATMQDFGDRS